MHDPTLREQRVAWGKVRHPRFAKVLADLPLVNRASVPTIAGILDSLLDIADEARREVGCDGRCKNAPGLAVAVSALRAAMAGLELERVWLARHPPMSGDGVPQTLEEQLSS